MLKVKNLIKNTSSKLHQIHQGRGVLKPRQTSKMEISAKTAKGIQSLTVFAKTPSQKSGWVLNTCYKIVVRKFPIYKLKQKRAKKVN